LLTDAKAPKAPKTTMLHFLAEQLITKQGPVMEKVAEAVKLFDDALLHINVTQLLFPSATVKYYEIVNIIKSLNREQNREFIEEMEPFGNKLREALLSLNEQLQAIDLEIGYFGGIEYDALTWGGNSNISDLSGAWNKLLGPGILITPEVQSRILRDSVRYVFFAEMHKFFEDFHAAHLYNVSVAKKEEQQKKLKEKKEAEQKAKEAKAAAAGKMKPTPPPEPPKAEEQMVDILSEIESSMAEEKIVSAAKEQIGSVNIWQKVNMAGMAAKAFQSQGSTDAAPTEITTETADH